MNQLQNVKQLLDNNIITKEEYDGGVAAFGERVARLSEMIADGKITREQMQRQIFSSVQPFAVALMLHEIKTRVLEGNISDARSLLDFLLSEEFSSKIKKLLEPLEEIY